MQSGISPTPRRKPQHTHTHTPAPNLQRLLSERLKLLLVLVSEFVGSLGCVDRIGLAGCGTFSDLTGEGEREKGARGGENFMQVAELNFQILPLV